MKQCRVNPHHSANAQKIFLQMSSIKCTLREDTLIPVETMEANLVESLGHHSTGEGRVGGVQITH